MPIDHTINTLNTFNPVAIRAMREAFEDAMRKLERDDRAGAGRLSEEMQAKLAREIVELARRGERDVTRLRDEALAGLELIPRDAA